jgi:pimeloyl-ACP methyl ester carboxylesterase
MGGYIAQELALNYPDKVTSLVLGCTGCGGDRAVLMSPERMEKFTANKGLNPEKILRKDMDIYFSDDYVSQNPEKIEEFVDISMRYYQPADAFFRQFDACLRHDTGDRLGHISAPTLVMTGDDDPLVPPQNSKILKNLIPGAELSVFAGGRHCFFIEQADRFNQEAIDFFIAGG